MCSKDFVQLGRKNEGEENLRVQATRTCADRRALDVDPSLGTIPLATERVHIAQNKSIKDAVVWRQAETEGCAVGWDASLDQRVQTVHTSGGLGSSGCHGPCCGKSRGDERSRKHGTTVENFHFSKQSTRGNKRVSDVRGR